MLVFWCMFWRKRWNMKDLWTATSEFGTYRLCEQRRFRRACASAQSRQNLRCSLIQAESQEEPSDRKPVPWPLWMVGHAQLKFVMTQCSKTQIRLTRLLYTNNCQRRMYKSFENTFTRGVLTRRQKVILIEFWIVYGKNGPKMKC